MRASVVLLAACGRLGFPDQPAPDAPVTIDAGVAGLVVEYPMDDDPSGGTIASPQRPATCTTCPTATTGVRGGGYHFDGTQGFAIGDLLDANYTVLVWARFEADAPDSDHGRPLVSKPIAGTELDAFNLLAISTVIAFESSAGTATDYLPDSIPVVLDTWHAYAASWDGAMKRLYRDGVLIGFESATIAASPESVYVGEDVDFGTATFFLIGALDELRIYDRALTDAEIQLLSAP